MDYSLDISKTKATRVEFQQEVSQGISSEDHDGGSCPELPGGHPVGGQKPGDDPPAYAEAEGNPQIPSGGFGRDCLRPGVHAGWCPELHPIAHGPQDSQQESLHARRAEGRASPKELMPTSRFDRKFSFFSLYPRKFIVAICQIGPSTPTKSTDGYVLPR